MPRKRNPLIEFEAHAGGDASDAESSLFSEHTSDREFIDDSRDYRSPPTSTSIHYIQDIFASSTESSDGKSIIRFSSAQSLLRWSRLNQPIFCMMCLYHKSQGTLSAVTPEDVTDEEPELSPVTPRTSSLQFPAVSVDYLSRLWIPRARLTTYERMCRVASRDCV